MFDKSVMDIDIVTWCKWSLGFFNWTFQLQNKTNMNAQNNTRLGTCQVSDILYI